jgi:hypothetical protein
MWLSGALSKERFFFFKLFERTFRANEEAVKDTFSELPDSVDTSEIVKKGNY